MFIIEEILIRLKIIIELSVKILKNYLHFPKVWFMINKSHTV